MMKQSKKLIALILLVILTVQVFSFSTVFAAPYYTDGSATPTSNVLNVNGFYPSIVIDDFNSPEDVSQWQRLVIPGVPSLASIMYCTTFANSPGTPYEGSGCIHGDSDYAKAYTWRTMYKEYATPLDLSGVKYLTLAANCNGGFGAGHDHILKISLYSGADKYVGIAKIDADKWNKIALDMSSWSGRNSITKIELSYTFNYDLEGLSPGQPGYDYWGANFQVDYLTGSNALDMDFNINGETEGFTAQAGTLAAANSELGLTVTGANPYLQSPSIIQDMSKVNTIAVSLKNASEFSKVKVAWITEADQTWDTAKSEIFDITPNSSGSYSNYEFNCSINQKWAGTLKQFRIYFIGDAITTGSIAIDKFQFKQLASLFNYPGKIDTCRITDGAKIAIGGTVKAEDAIKYAGDSLELFELQPYENENNLSGKTALAAVPIANSFSFETDLTDQGRSRIYSKFVVAIKHQDSTYTLADSAQYITNPEAVAQNIYPFPTAKSKKGLQVAMVGDAEDLGISHAALNVNYSGALYVDGSVNPENTLTYQYEGQNYYFKKDWVRNYDNGIKSLSDNNIIVTLILLMYRENMDDTTPNKDLIHPDADTSGIVYAFNTTNETGLRYYKAITNFIAERYTRQDQKYGRAVNYIVGNEIDASQPWYNMGPKLIGDYIKDYARTLRITNTILKSNYSNARVYISLTHDWDHALPANSTWTYDGRAIVDNLNTEIKEHGDIPWNIAYHPYPEDIFDPKCWNAPNSTEGFDTDKITFKNMHVLVDYMKQQNYLYNGAPRRIILSEEGFTSGDNSLENQKIQAAAYAYAYYTTRFLDGIDSFILHRHVDHAGEMGLNLGLWTHNPDTSVSPVTPYQHKYIYDVFKYIDTDRSLEVTDFAKDIIGIKNWEDIIPGFDSKALSERTLTVQTTAGTVTAQQLTEANTLSDFEKGTDGWTGAENVSGVDVSSAEKLSGSQSLKATNLWSEATEYKGVSKVFDTPADFSSKPYLYFGIKPSSVQENAPGGNPKPVYKLLKFNANSTLNSIKIDGVPDESDWNLNQSMDVISGSTNNTAKFGATWDDKYLYAAFDITDASVENSNDPGGPWNDDSVELYIDGDLNKGVYNGHTAQYVFRWNDPAVYAFGAGTAAGVIQKMAKTDKGYTVEVAIPWSFMGGLSVCGGKSIGITAHVNDRNTDSSNNTTFGTLGLTYDVDNDWQTSKYWAEMTLIKKFEADKVTGSLITGDGKIDDAAWQQANWNLSQEMNVKSGITNSTAKFGTMWDDKYLYTTFDITDASVENSNDPGGPWNDDSVELYIDGDLNRGLFNGSTARTAQYIFRWNDSTVYKFGSDAATTDGIVYNMATTGTGYTLKAAIPWASIGITAPDGKTVGFTAHVNDRNTDSNNNVTMGTLGWTYKMDNDWADSSYWAEMRLSGGVFTEKAIAVTAAIDAINALPAAADLVLADKTRVEAARSLVNAAKAKGAVDADITNLQKLVECETKLAALEKEITEIKAYSVRIKVYSSDSVCEAVTTVKPDVWNMVAVDLSKWARKNAVTRIKIWVRPENQASWNNCSFYVDDIGQAVLKGEDSSLPAIEIQDNVNKSDDSGTGINKDKDAKVTITPYTTVDNAAGTSTSVVTQEDLKTALLQAQQDINGVKRIVVKIPETAGIEQYIQELPLGELSSNSLDKKIEIQAPVGTVVVPGNMFSAGDFTGETKVQLVIKKADEPKLDGDYKQKIGDRPAIELNAVVGNKTVAWSNSGAPVTVKIDYKPTAEELKDPEHIVVWYIDDSGNVVPVPNGKYDRTAGAVTFTTTHFSRYAVAFVRKEFNDVGNYGWAKNAIEIMASKGVINGTSGNTYSPEKSITRGDFMLLLVKSLGLTAKVESNFADVKKADYYYEAVGIAKQLGITEGLGNNKFNPKNFLTRQDMMVFVERALHVTGKTELTDSVSDIGNYKDVSAVSPYALQSVAALIKQGLIKGNGIMINPSAYTTRAEAATLAYRLYNME